MQTYQEIEYWYVLPSIRGLLAKELQNKGLKQNEIAKVMHLTPPAVSQYLKGKRGREIKFDVQITNHIKLSANNLVKKGNLLQELNDICQSIKNHKFSCKLHKAHEKNLPRNCEVCRR